MKTIKENILAIPAEQIISHLIPALYELGFFQALFRLQPVDAEHFASETGWNARVLAALLNYLASEGYLVHAHGQQSVYRLSEETKCLFVEPNDELGAWINLTRHLAGKKIESDILQAFTTGEPASWNSGEAWSQAMGGAETAEVFSCGMHARAKLIRDDFISALLGKLEGVKNLLDIGGSYGAYSQAIKRGLGIDCTVMDLPSVVSAAKNRNDNSDVTFVEGDMFQNIPRGYDAHLFSNVLHDWDEDKNSDLLARSYAALNHGGAIIVHDLMQTGNKDAARHGLYLAIYTEGRGYSFAEVEAMLRRARFVRINKRKTTAGYGIVVGWKGSGK